METDEKECCSALNVIISGLDSLKFIIIWGVCPFSVSNGNYMPPLLPMANPNANDLGIGDRVCDMKAIIGCHA